MCMFKRLFAKQPDPDLEAAISAIHAKMREEDPGSDEYLKLIDQLTKLKALKTNTSRKPVDSNTLWLVIGNVVVVVIIVAYEQKHVMASKSLGFINKLKP